MDCAGTLEQRRMLDSMFNPSIYPFALSFGPLKTIQPQRNPATMWDFESPFMVTQNTSGARAAME